MTQTLEAPQYTNNIRFELGVSTSTRSLGLPNVRLIRKTKVGEKQVAFIYFHTEAQRQQYIDTQAKNAAGRAESIAAEAAAKRAAKASFINPYKIGDVLYTSWGYDQTNIDFYQVTGLTAKGIKFRELCQNEVPGEGISPLAGYTIPIKDSFRARSGGAACKEEFRAVQVYVGSNGISTCISFDGHYLRIWDGKPQYASHYA